MKICHKESDAKNKLCPLSLGAGDDAVLCQGSHCMAWQWVLTHVKNLADPQGDLIPSTDTYGVCGMAAPHSYKDYNS